MEPKTLQVAIDTMQRSILGLLMTSASSAGPEGMVENVMQACSAHNDLIGLCGKPWAHAIKHTYNL